MITCVPDPNSKSPPGGAGIDDVSQCGPLPMGLLT